MDKSDKISGMETIRQVIYISQASRPMQQQDIEQLVVTASRNNRQLGITGALLYIENSFVQVLEGEDAPITRLLATIESDPRHRNMRILSDRTVDFRNFEEWSMAYVKPDPQDASIIIGELQSTSFPGGDEDPIVMPLPHTFAMMRHLYETDATLQRARSNT